MTTSDLVCFSHQRWGFVFGRPNHLMVRFARRYRTFFVEEPRVLAAGQRARLDIRQHPDGPWICVPWVPAGLDPRANTTLRRELFADALCEHRIYPRMLWFYTARALDIAGELDVPLVVYDCMAEMSVASAAEPALAQREAELLRRADLVFTAEQRTCCAVRRRHHAVHCFPNDLDAGPGAAWDETFERMIDCLGEALITNRRASSVTRRDAGRTSAA